MAVDAVRARSWVVIDHELGWVLVIQGRPVRDDFMDCLKMRGKGSHGGGQGRVHHGPSCVGTSENSTPVCDKDQEKYSQNILERSRRSVAVSVMTCSGATARASLRSPERPKDRGGAREQALPCRSDIGRRSARSVVVAPSAFAAATGSPGTTGLSSRRCQRRGGCLRRSSSMAHTRDAELSWLVPA